MRVALIKGENNGKTDYSLDKNPKKLDKKLSELNNDNILIFVNKSYIIVNKTKLIK